jgi:hypothetical protein
MPALLFVLIVRLMADVFKIVRKRRSSRRCSRCIDCAYAHVQYATNGRTAISCTFAGTVRQMLIDVMCCTDFRDRNARPQTATVGFVCKITDAEGLGEVAAARR